MTFVLASLFSGAGSSHGGTPVAPSPMVHGAWPDGPTRLPQPESAGAAGAKSAQLTDMASRQLVLAGSFCRTLAAIWTSVVRGGDAFASRVHAKAILGVPF